VRVELLDRYLQAVRFWLPKNQKQDVPAELLEEIRSQIEEREAELGRPLTDADLEVILKRWGNPILVAGRYLPKEYLIGPALFPIYKLLLKAALLYYFVPWLVVWICIIVFDSGYRATQVGVSAVAALKPLFVTSLCGFAFITIAFALLDRFQAKSRFLEKWDPGKLPALRRTNEISRCNSAAEAAWFVFLALWWVDAVRFPAIPGIHVALAPALSQSFRWPVLLLMAASAARAFVNTVRPWWSNGRAGVRLAINGFGLILAVLMLNAAPWVEVTSTTANAADIARWINLNVRFLFLIYAMSFLLRGIQDFLRVLGKPPISSRAIDILTGA
jgi:hypothetical protein